MPQDEFFDGAIELLAPRRADVCLRGLRLEHLPLGAPHSVEDRCVAAEIAKNAHSQVDFLREGVGAKLGHQSEDGVGRQTAQLLEQALSPGSVPEPL